MKRFLHPLSYVAVMIVAFASCNKESTPPPPLAAKAEMSLTSDEMLRLQLLASNGTRDESGVLQAVQDYTASITKASTGIAPVIKDSMVFGTATKAGAEPLVIYIVSNGPGRGFTLVNKDSRLTPVLGYSDSGEYSGESNPGFEILMANIAAEQSYLRDSIAALAGDSISQSVQYKLGLVSGPTKGADPEDRPPGPPPGVQWDRVELETDRTWYQTDAEVAPLLKTTWSQSGPFNSWRSDGFPAGCTATAAAQLMKFYNHPSVSPISGRSLFWATYPLTPYNWPAFETINVGKLMEDLGSYNCLNITYKSDGSWAFCSNTPRTFEKFGYYGGAHGNYNYTSVRSDLLNGRPVHVCGNSNPISGHTWLIDGFNDQSYWAKTYTVFYYQGNHVYTISNAPTILSTRSVAHHNFGWGGSRDGWFSYNGADVVYNQQMKIITGIRPRP